MKRYMAWIQTTEEVEELARKICAHEHGAPDQIEVASGDGVDPMSTYCFAWQLYIDEAEKRIDLLDDDPSDHWGDTEDEESDWLKAKV
jgi:hypothetical protein